jgi:hypothetical protein
MRIANVLCAVYEAKYKNCPADPSSHPGAAPNGGGQRRKCCWRLGHVPGKPARHRWLDRGRGEPCLAPVIIAGYWVRGMVAGRTGPIDSVRRSGREPADVARGVSGAELRARRLGVLMVHDRGIVRRFGTDRPDRAVVRDRGDPVVTAGITRSIGAAAVAYHRSPPGEPADHRRACPACPKSHSLPQVRCGSVDTATPQPLNFMLTTSEQGATRRPQSQVGGPRLRTRKSGRRAGGWRGGERASTGRSAIARPATHRGLPS